MSNKKLSEQLEYFKLERPSEFMMAEWVRDAEELEAQLAESAKAWMDLKFKYQALEAQLEQIEEICTDANRTKTDTGLRNIIAQIWHITQARLEKSDENKT